MKQIHYLLSLTLLLLVANTFAQSKIDLSTTDIKIITQDQDRVIVDNNGNMGVGTTTPAHKLDISSNHSQLRLTDSDDGNYISLSYSSDVLAFRNNTDTGLTPTLSLHDNGNVGIGTTNPINKLDVLGGSRFYSHSENIDVSINNFGVNQAGYARLTISNHHGGSLGLIATDDSPFQGIPIDAVGIYSTWAKPLVFGVGYSSTDVTEKFRITNTQISSSVGVCAPSFTTCSDKRFKKNIQNLNQQEIVKIQRLRPVSYDWNTKGFPQRDFSGEKQYGFIAQEIQELFPEMVSKDREGYLSVNYTALIPLMVTVIQTQEERIQTLEEGRESLGSNTLTPQKHLEGRVLELENQNIQLGKDLAQSEEANQQLLQKLIELEQRLDTLENQ